MDQINKKLILKNATIVLKEKIIEHGSIVIKNNKIFKIYDFVLEKGIDLNNNILLPGFIDCHIHGGYGVDFEIGDKNRFNFLASKLVEEGITNYVQASVTNSIKNNDKYIQEFSEFFIRQNPNHSQCLGLHLEGPFISKEKNGAHLLELILKPDIYILKKWINLSKNSIRIITFAPENQNGEFTKFCLNNKIIPSAGHSNINFIDFKKHYQDGIRHITHILNGMSKLENGLALAGFNYKDILSEVISDGLHLSNDLLKLIYQQKGYQNLTIISDSINAKGQRDGTYKLGTIEVIKQGIKIFRKDNLSLAGSGATYIHNVKKYYEVIGMPLNHLIHMTSINIAKQLNIFDVVGEIKETKLANLVVINKDFRILKTIINGKIIFENTI